MCPFSPFSHSSLHSPCTHHTATHPPHHTYIPKPDTSSPITMTSTHYDLHPTKSSMKTQHSPPPQPIPGTTPGLLDIHPTSATTYPGRSHHQLLRPPNMVQQPLWYHTWSIGYRNTIYGANSDFINIRWKGTYSWEEVRAESYSGVWILQHL